MALKLPKIGIIYVLFQQMECFICAWVKAHEIWKTKHQKCADAAEI